MYQADEKRRKFFSLLWTSHNIVRHWMKNHFPSAAIEFMHVMHLSFSHTHKHWTHKTHTLRVMHTLRVNQTHIQTHETERMHTAMLVLTCLLWTTYIVIHDRCCWHKWSTYSLIHNKRWGWSQSHLPSVYNTEQVGNLAYPCSPPPHPTPWDHCCHRDKNPNNVPKVIAPTA